MDFMAEASGIGEDATAVVLVYVTFPSKESATLMARKLLEDKKVACANIFSAQDAMFYWDGELECEKQVSVLFKTMSSALPEVEKIILESHPFEVPCIMSWDMSGGHEEYLQWVQDQVAV